jgi:hypothetical protein
MKDRYILSALDLAYEIVFARAREEGWRFKARTIVDNVGGYPPIGIVAR